MSMRGCTWLAAIAVSAALGFAGKVYAVGTVAGTNIQNTAQVSYTVGGSTLTQSSNATNLTVAEILDANVVALANTVGVSPGSTNQVLSFRVTNTGNGSEAFRLTGDSVLPGDDFDPTPASPYIYLDTDGSNTLTPGDTVYSAGANDPVLAPDAHVTVFVLNNIAAGLPNNAQGRGRLTAAAVTGTGAPGTVFAGAGTGGTDAVAGTSGGSAQFTAAYVVAGIQVALNKTQTIVDPFGGSRPVPGARINYQITVTPSGTGTATAVVFTDPIPSNTTYVPASLQLNGTALTDGADADAGQIVSGAPSQVRVALGDLTQVSGAHTITFAVTIN